MSLPIIDISPLRNDDSLGIESTAIEIYEAYTSALIEIVRQFPSTASLAVLAGHNPSITTAINSLADMGIMNVPTCGVGVLRFETESWDEVGESGAELIDYDFPKNRPGHGK